MKRLLLVFVFLGIAACAGPKNSSTLILNYSDFGPPSMSSELIGREWWQWQSHGDSRPRQYDVKVVVYRGLTIAAVQEKFPVISVEKKDYRYLEYSDAVNYLDKNITENIIPAITKDLNTTRSKILQSF